MGAAMAVGLADNRGAGHQQSLPDEVGGRVRAHRSVLRARGDVVAVVAAGGALGSLARFAVAEGLPRSQTGFPWATFLVNVTGCFLLGLLMVLVLEVWPPYRLVRPFLGVGVLGGYTTFSAYALEARDLMASGQVVTALGYVGGSLLAGLLAVAGGVAAMRVAVVRSEDRRTRRPG